MELMVGFMGVLKQIQCSDEGSYHHVWNVE